MRTRFILIIYALLGLFTTAPILSMLLATLVAGLCGAPLSEAGSHPTVVLGVDLGPLLASMFVSSWLAIITLPCGLLAIVVFTVVVVIERPGRPGT